MSSSLEELLKRQNKDGGWSWVPGGTSWTEPTAYALLALALDPVAREAGKRGVSWLEPVQRADGGWRPNPTVDHSTWVTALAVLNGGLSGKSRTRGIDWLLRQKARGSTWTQRMLGPLFGVEALPLEYPAWPWFPGTAPWTTPTSLAILALKRAASETPEAVARAHEAQQFLLSKVCNDGGWNYGSPRAAGSESSSYPETTGIALVALHGVDSPVLRNALGVAGRMLPKCRSSEGAGWVRMGLACHGAAPATSVATTPRTTVDLAIEALAEAAVRGRHLLLERV
jgi:hypothetical protein